MYNYWTKLLLNIQGIDYLLILPRQAEAILTTIRAL
jgi:hypothetical protein